MPSAAADERPAAAAATNKSKKSRSKAAAADAPAAPAPAANGHRSRRILLQHQAGSPRRGSGMAAPRVRGIALRRLRPSCDAPQRLRRPEIDLRAKASGKVWVNTESGVYHKSGRWYGKTKQGKFMTESEAQAAGYKAAQKE